MADNTKLVLFGAAGVAVWWFYIRKPAAPSTPAATAAPGPPAIVGANSLDAIFVRLQAAAKAPAAGLSVDEWGYFLNNELAPLGKSAPDPMGIFPTAVPNFDRSQKITAAQYWGVMAPALKSQLGLSGLGMYGHLGAMAMGYR